MSAPIERPLRIALYARVSDDEDQTPENQLLRLREWAITARLNDRPIQIVGEYVDQISSRDTRPQKENVLRMLSLGQLEGVAFIALDRWGRTRSELMDDLDTFRKRGWVMLSLKEGFRFDTAAGNLYAGLLAIFADFEREIIRERTKAGVHRAKVQGKIRGRHPVGCGCGQVPLSKDGERMEDKRHDGPIKPVREGAVIVAWRYPDGTVRPVGWARNNPPLQNPPSAAPIAHGETAGGSQ